MHAHGTGGLRPNRGNRGHSSNGSGLKVSGVIIPEVQH